MDIIITIIVGLIAGTLGKFLLPGKDPGGLIVTILIGIAGSFLGNFIGAKLPIFPTGDGFSIMSIVTATIGAIILLLIYRLITKKK